MQDKSRETVIFGGRSLTISDILAVARSQAEAQVSEEKSFRDTIRAGEDYLKNMLFEQGIIYGVTTGYGDSCTVDVADNLVEELPLHLTRFHGCGMGRILDQEQTRAVIAVRLASLAHGYSGVRPLLLDRLAWLLNHNILPLIPEEGSVGASGDLTPLSYVAAALIGEREVMYKGEQRQASDVYTELGVTPLTLQPKEGLAIMNGTAVMTALAILAYDRAVYLKDLSCRMTSLAVMVMKGNAGHFDAALFAVKPHPGQMDVAAKIRHDLRGWADRHTDNRLQDRYSLRCAPHIIGVLADAMPMMHQFIETELNSTNDNPVICPDGAGLLHGGHFYGGHIAFVMDSLKNCIANLADMMDRQMALLVDTKYNNGLPSNLSAAKGDRAAINHGFKAVQIGVSAWTAEALKNSMPASVFSRSTECHNQDKVSMGTIAARDCLRSLQLTEQVAAALLMAVQQGYRIRQQSGRLKDDMAPEIDAFIKSLAQQIPLIEEDRPLESELRQMVAFIQQQKWALY